MADLKYDALQREIARRVLRYTFVRGQGGPLTLLWALGVGAFLVVWPLPEFAAVWTVACLALAGLMIRDYLHSPRARAAVSKDLLATRFPTDRLSEAGHREAIRQSVDVFLELLAKLTDIKRSRGLEEEVADSVSEMDRLLALECESARQVEELERILRLVGAEQKLEASGTVGLHQENAAAIQKEIVDADALVEVIGQQIETLLLQVYRYEAGATDLLAKVEARRRSAETMDRIQQKVDARRHAAKQLIELVVPDWEGEPVSLEPTSEGKSGTPSNGHAVQSPEATDLGSLTYPLANGTAAEANGEEDGDECVRLLGEALRNLHHPSALASSELIDRLPHSLAAARAALGYQDTGQPTPLEQAKALAQVLIAAIARLKPEQDGAGSGVDSLQYSILAEEYLQAKSTTAVMMRHAIGESTLHRHRKRGVEILARELRAQEDRLAGEQNSHS